MRVVALALVLALVAGGCATSTRITTDPPGALVIDPVTKKELGKTPFTYESKMWMWESQKLTIKAAGFKTKTIELKRTDPDLVPLIGGICLVPCCLGGVPIILAGGLKMPEVTPVKMEAGESALWQPTPGAVQPVEQVAVRY